MYKPSPQRVRLDTLERGAYLITWRDIMDSNPMPDKDAESAEIAAQTAEYLKKNTIEVVPSFHGEIPPEEKARMKARASINEKRRRPTI
jgi:hypothetical protein